MLPLAGEAEPAFCGLEPRVVGLWRLVGGIWVAVLALGLVPLAVIAAASGRVVPCAVALGVLPAFAALAWWWPPRSHAAWGYRVDDRVLELRSGVVFRVVRLLPLSRIQHADVHSGPLERGFGLATLVLHTAGTHDSTVALPGLAAGEAAALRDRLIAAGGDDGV